MNPLSTRTPGSSPVYGSSEGSGESVHMRRLAWAFAARRCDRYRNLMHSPKCIQLRQDFLPHRVYSAAAQTNKIIVSSIGLHHFKSRNISKLPNYSARFAFSLDLAGYNYSKICLEYFCYFKARKSKYKVRRCNNDQDYWINMLFNVPLFEKMD